MGVIIKKTGCLSRQNMKLSKSGSRARAPQWAVDIIYFDAHQSATFTSFAFSGGFKLMTWLCNNVASVYYIHFKLGTQMRF